MRQRTRNPSDLFQGLDYGSMLNVQRQGLHTAQLLAMSSLTCVNQRPAETIEDLATILNFQHRVSREGQHLQQLALATSNNMTTGSNNNVPSPRTLNVLQYNHSCRLAVGEALFDNFAMQRDVRTGFLHCTLFIQRALQRQQEEDGDDDYDNDYNDEPEQEEENSESHNHRHHQDDDDNNDDVDQNQGGHGEQQMQDDDGSGGSNGLDMHNQT